MVDGNILVIGQTGKKIYANNDGKTGRNRFLVEMITAGSNAWR